MPIELFSSSSIYVLLSSRYLYNGIFSLPKSYMTRNGVEINFPNRFVFRSRRVLVTWLFEYISPHFVSHGCVHLIGIVVLIAFGAAYIDCIYAFKVLVKMPLIVRHLNRGEKQRMNQFSTHVSFDTTYIGGIFTCLSNLMQLYGQRSLRRVVVIWDHISKSILKESE